MRKYWGIPTAGRLTVDVYEQNTHAANNFTLQVAALQSLTQGLTPATARPYLRQWRHKHLFQMDVWAVYKILNRVANLPSSSVFWGLKTLQLQGGLAPWTPVQGLRPQTRYNHPTANPLASPLLKLITQHAWHGEEVGNDAFASSANITS